MCMRVRAEINLEHFPKCSLPEYAHSSLKTSGKCPEDSKELRECSGSEQVGTTGVFASCVI